MKSLFLDTKKYKTLVIYGDERVGNPLFRMSSGAISKSFTVKKNRVYISALPLTSCYCCSYLTQRVFSSAQSHNPSSWVKRRGSQIPYMPYSQLCLQHSPQHISRSRLFPSVYTITVSYLHSNQNKYKGSIEGKKRKKS